MTVAGDLDRPREWLTASANMQPMGVLDAIRAGPLPDQLILDPNTGSEKFLTGIGCVGFLVGWVCLFELSSYGWLPVAAGILLGALCFWLRSRLRRALHTGLRSPRTAF